MSLSGSLCYEWCPDFTATVSADGAIAFKGRHFTQLVGAHALPTNPALFAALSTLVADPSAWPKSAVLPDSSGCQPMISDQPEYSVSVVRAEGARDAFEVNLGCTGPAALPARTLATRVRETLAAYGVPTEGVRPETPIQ